MKVLRSFVVVAAVALSITACAKREPVKPPTVGGIRIAVLDGTVADPRAETRRSEAGWSVGRRHRFDDGNAGIAMADLLAIELRNLPNVRIHSREDVAAMMSQKERVVRSVEPELGRDDIYQVLLEQDPADYGRELNADYVVTNVVNEARMVYSPTNLMWWSTVQATIKVVDVSTGQVVWEWTGRDTDRLSGQFSVAEDLARHARKRLQEANVLKATATSPRS
jgi:hypothetical protein